MGSGQAATNPLYFLPSAAALAELIALVEADIAANWPGRRTAVTRELQTAVLKTRMRRQGGLPWQELKEVALGEQRFPAIRGATSDILKAERLRAVHIAATELQGLTSVCDGAGTTAEPASSTWQSEPWRRLERQPTAVGAWHASLERKGLKDRATRETTSALKHAPHSTRIGSTHGLGLRAAMTTAAAEADCTAWTAGTDALRGPETANARTAAAVQAVTVKAAVTTTIVGHAPGTAPHAGTDPHAAWQSTPTRRWGDRPTRVSSGSMGGQLQCSITIRARR